MSALNTCGRIHVPINLSKCCYCTELMGFYLKQLYDRSSHSSLVHRGEQLDLIHQQQRSDQRDISSHLQSDLSWSQISDKRGRVAQTGCSLDESQSAQAVKRSRGLPHIFARVTFVLASLHFPSPSVVLMKLSRSCHSLMSGCASQHDG